MANDVHKTLTRTHQEMT